MKRILIIFYIFLISQILNSCRETDKQTNPQKQSKSGITGTIVYQGTPVNWAYGYLYKTSNVGFRQEFLEASEPTGTDGKFVIYIKQGKYYFVSRKRWNYAKIGPLRTGDFEIIYFNNPVEIKENQILNIGEIELNEIREEWENIPEGSGIKGKAVLENNQTEDIFVYIYTNPDTELRGPSYYLTKPIEKNGNFKINLLPGKYYLVARKRKSGAKLGPLEEEDYNYVYLQNPIKVNKNEYFDAGELRLKKIDIKKLVAIKKGTLPPKIKLSTGIRGFIFNKKKEPVKDVYAFIYKDFQMVGKPLYRSSPTNKDGKFEILLSEGGIYYVGARNTFGGPLEPGDIVGSYNGSPDHLLKVKNGEILENINIVVEEFQ